MIAILHAYGHLDLAADTELPQEENSKKQDANIINLDFSASFNLPYSPENIQDYDRYGFDKFRCQLYSDGFLIGEYTAKFRENTFNHTDKTGSLTIQLTTLYDSLREDMDAMKLPDALDGIYWTINPASMSPSAGETKIHKWLALEQGSPSGTYPFRFPEYAIVDKYDGSFPVPEYEEDTLKSDDKFGFGKWVPVNHFNNEYKRLSDRTALTVGTTPLYPDKYVEYNVLYDRISYNMKFFDTQENAPIFPGTTQSGAGFSHFYRNDPQPRRIWGLACPCFPYLWVLEKSLEKMGFRLDIQWDNQDHKELFENLLILNNYNIFDVIVSRIEGYARYWETVPFGGTTLTQEDIGMRTYWVGAGNPLFASLPTTSVLEYSSYNVIAKNHVPDITVSNIVDDFIAKTNMEIVLDGNSVIFRKPIIVQDENKRVFNPEIKVQAFEWKMKKKLTYKYDDERDDNIPDYVLVSDGDQEENIESPIVPVYLHYKDRPSADDGYFPFIVGAPAINKDLCQVNLNIYEDHIFGKSTFVGGWAALTWNNTIPPAVGYKELKAEYGTAAVPKFCGVYIPKSLLPNVGMYYFFDDKKLEAIAAPYHLNGRTLKWQDSTGIFDNNYKDYLAIFKAKLVHLFSEVYNPETFQRFSHYKFFNLLGRKVFGMKRKYTLPLSKNPLIEYEGYESE